MFLSMMVKLNSLLDSDEITKHVKYLIAKSKNHNKLLSLSISTEVLNNVVHTVTLKQKVKPTPMSYQLQAYIASI